MARVAAVGKGKRRRKRADRGPNPKSTPKEIAGKHGHKPHGKSILWPALYEHLRAKGMTKSKAAQISNGMWRKKRGLPPKSVPGSKGKVPIGKAGAVESVGDVKEAVVAEMSSGGRSLSVAARENAAEAGFALPDGKLPIRNRDELAAAISLRGKVEGHSMREIRDHIVRRARALDAVADLPEAWRMPKQGAMQAYRCAKTGGVMMMPCAGCPNPAACAM